MTKEMDRTELRPVTPDGARIEGLDVPQGFDRGDVLAEFVRGTSHLFRGIAKGRGIARSEDSGLTLWCCRQTAHMTSMHCAVFPASDHAALGTSLQAITAILPTYKPDAATIRVLVRNNAEAIEYRKKIIYAKGYIIVSLGEDQVREVIKIPGDFSQFVSGLGKKTRSHIRSSLRTFEQEGYVFRFQNNIRLIPSPEIRDLSLRNIPFAPPDGDLENNTDFINTQDEPFISTISAKDGTLVSVIRGYMLDGYAALIDQMNPRDIPRIGQAGHSLLHRALLIRHLIAIGAQGLIVTGGCGGMLFRYCNPISVRTYLVVPANPFSWLRCLSYSRINPQLYRWGFQRLLKSAKITD